MIRQLIGPMLYQAGQWYRSATSIIRPRNTTDQIVIGTTQQGTPPASAGHLSVDSNSANAQAIAARGYISTDGLVVTANSTCNPGIVLTESANDFTCFALLTISGGTVANAAIYVKNNQLVIAYICGANGQMRYASLTLDGQTCTWATRSSGP